ncbi:MAG: YggS family pyridoxal phosphate-dependent enzyme, partial [Acidimicrobiales bacterium]
MSSLPDLATFQQRLATIRERVATCGVEPSAVEVLPVSKAFGPQAVELAIAAGCKAVGENYAQELIAKQSQIRSAQPQWHFIGRLQSNKIRKLAPVVDVWQSLDRVRVVDEVAKRSPGASVLLQVAISDEAQKGGVSVAETPALIEHAREVGLRVRGLMGVSSLDAHAVVGAQFALLRRLVDEQGLEVCSMGMTDDLELAVAEGSTMLRIGRALFGPRTPEQGL